MEKFGRSQPAHRVEDVRFLTGRGRFVDDIPPEDALFAFVFRAPVAHATIITLDLTDARKAAGVHLVQCADDLAAAGVFEAMDCTVVESPEGTKGAAPRRPLLAEGKLRFVGEPVALIVAENLQQARDAAELIEFEYDDLPAHMGLTPGGEALHDEVPDNRAFDWAIGDEAATEAKFAQAARVVRMQVSDNRVMVNSIEPRGCYAQVTDGRLHVAFNGQGVWDTKDSLARIFGLKPDAVHVTTPDVGGGFGMKAMDYPETFLVAHAARVLNRPVRWMSDRLEAMQSDNGGRDLEHDVALAFDSDLRMTGYRVDTRCNLGAYNSEMGQLIQTDFFAMVLAGPYDLRHTFLRAEGFYTNTAQTDAYRGAGRAEAIYVLERIVDRAARELGVSTWELHRRNFIAPSAFPYVSSTGETYDVGEFGRVLEQAKRAADVDGFAARKAESAGRGRLRGQGLCYYIQSVAGGETEKTKVEFNPDGTVTMFTGSQSTGQGHETVYAQFLSDHTGIPVTCINVVQGDSDLIRVGGGTGGSSSVSSQSNATLEAVKVMIAAFTPYLAGKMAVTPDEVSFDGERFRGAGSNLTPTMLEVTQMALAEGREDLLVHRATGHMPQWSFPNGAHVAEVEVDPDTGKVVLQSYTVVDDFGNLINPMLVEAQVHGGVVQGIGQALTEHVVFDEDGQLLTASFMDYAMPRALDIPMLRFMTEPVPSTTNPMGMKGCGEAGTVGAMAATANAVADALWDAGVRQADMPFTPHRVWKMLNDAMAQVD